MLAQQWLNNTRAVMDRIEQTQLDNIRRAAVAMAGIYVTDERLKTLSPSHAYYHSPVALIVRSERAGEFLDRTVIMAMPTPNATKIPLNGLLVALALTAAAGVGSGASDCAAATRSASSMNASNSMLVS